MDEVGDITTQPRHLLHQAGRYIGIVLSWGEEHRLDSGGELTVHAGQLELILEVGDRAQATQYYLCIALLGSIDQQRIETGGAVSFLAGSQRGVVGALSLEVSIRDRDGTQLFLNRGGIEVLDKIAGKEFIHVPRQELFSDKSRNEEAVRIALKQLKR